MKIIGVENVSKFWGVILPFKFFNIEVRSAGGIGGFGVFAGGIFNNAVSSQLTQTYNYSTDVVNSGSNLGIGRRYMGACGNYTVGIFAGGLIHPVLTNNISNYVDKFIFSNNSVVQGTNLNTQGATNGVGNNTIGIFSSSTLYTNLYTYSSDTIVAGGNLIESHGNGGAAGNGIFGIIQGGGYIVGQGNVNKVQKYTYSNNTVTYGTNLDRFYAARDISAFGNTAVGIFAGGYSFYSERFTSKYNYQNNAVLGGSWLGVPRFWMGVSSNSLMGVLVGGEATSYTDKYNLSNDLVVHGTTLSTVSNCSGVSSKPGGF